MMYSLILPLLFVLFYIFKKVTSRNNTRIPPGPFRWPILGSFPQMLAMGSKYPHIQMTGLARKYGNIISLGFGVNYAVLISSYEVMKDLLRRSETNMQRFRFQFSDHRSYNKNLGIIWAYGDVWAEQRKFTVKYLKEFGFGKMRSMDDTMREEMDALVDDMRVAVKSTNGIWNVDANRLQAVPINIMWCSVAGYRFDTSSERFKRHLKLNSDVFDVIGLRNLLVLFPFLKVFPRLSGYKQYDKVHRECQDFMKEVIEDAKQKRVGREEPESFVEVYLDEIEKNKNNPESTMTEEQLIVVLMDLFLAGSETTSTGINWITFYMAKYPQIQEKARRQILKCSKDGTELISLKDRSSMPYIHAIILETMRHSSFTPIPPARTISKDIEYNGYTLEKGACLLYNLHSVDHDKEFWGDHDVFRPERYFANDDDDSELVAEKVERVCHFGFGHRVCPFENIAMDTMFMFLVTLLPKFAFEILGVDFMCNYGNPALRICPRPYTVKLTCLN